MTLLIRDATPADADAIHRAILAMGTLLGTAHKITSTPEILARGGLARGRAFEGLVAEVDDVFAGMCLYLPVFSTWLGKPGVYIHDLFVDETHRGTRAQAFYERLGVTHYADDRIHAAYGEAFDRLSEGDNI
jgi:hypothetical protein